MHDSTLSSAYQAAKERYAALGVDTDETLRALAGIPVSLHCWQGDDVGGFETAGAQLTGGGIQATGNYHGKACRRIGAEIGRQLGSTTLTNVWIPDGYKDIPIDRAAPRERLTESLDRIFAEPLDPKLHLDAVEAKLFGIGAESYTAGSAE